MRNVSLWLAIFTMLLSGVVVGGQRPTNFVSQPSAARALMSSMSPNELVRRVVDNELNARATGHFMYRDRRETPDGSKTKEMIETPQGVVARLLAINGHPLTQQEREQENARLQNLIAHPELQAKKQKEQQQDEERVKRMFRELPNAFIYLYDGTEPGEWGEVIRLTFHPNPKYDPPSRETSVFKSMDGKLWIDANSQRLQKIEATLFQSVNFGWGILGHLDKGGHFFVAQSRIAPGRWESTYMNIQFTGKALLFKSINLRQIETLSDFRRVPDNLTLAQAVEMLNKTNDVVAENAGEVN